MQKTSGFRFTVVATLALLLAGCGGGMRTTRFVNPDFNFSFVERVAVLPMENLSNDPQAGVRATRLLMTELLATGAVDVVEIGEVRAALARVASGSAAPTAQQTVELGKSLQVQAVLLGSVTQSENLRSGVVTIPVVTVDVHMVETETGAPVWAATHSERGAGLSAKLLGTGAEPLSETTRRAVRRVVRALVR